jgi:hypothetical protein
MSAILNLTAIIISSIGITLFILSTFLPNSPTMTRIGINPLTAHRLSTQLFIIAIVIWVGMIYNYG